MNKSIPRSRILLVFLTLAAAVAQNSVSDARYAKLARGVNMNSVFQYGINFVVTAADRDLLKSAGFTCIRLPVAPEYILPRWSTPAAITSTLAQLDSVVDLFLSGGMAVQLDFHNDGTYLNYYLATPAAQQELVSTWQMFATRYANRDPELLFFEIMNEPTNQISQSDWDVEQKRVLAAIRQVAPRHTVLLSPVNWSGLDGLLGMTPYADTNVVYVLHDYNPMTFTHQGATWVDATTASLRNVPYPSYLPDLQTLINNTTNSAQRSLLVDYQAQDWTAEAMLWQLQFARAWADKWGVRIVVNEFGAYKPYGPHDGSRARWIHDMHSAFDKLGFAWAMWDYESGFDLVIGSSGSRIIDPDLTPALGFAPWTLPDPPRTGPPPAFTGIRTIQLAGAPVGNGYGETIVTADINSDGLLDLVMIPINWPSLPEIPVQVFINQGGGVMAPAVFNGPAPVQRFVSWVVPGMFDRSGRPGFFLPDIGPTDGSGAQSRLILPDANNALRDGTSALPQQIVATPGGAAGDVDHDGVDDLVVFYSGNKRLPMQLLRNDGSGRFQADAGAFPSWVSDLSRGDNNFNCGAFVRRRDEPVNDLVVAGWTGVPGRVFLNDGAGRFTAGAILPPPPNSAGAISGGCVAVADLNGDGHLDLIMGFLHTASNQPDVVQFLINNGDGTFHDETDLRIGPLPSSSIGLRRLSLVTATNGKARALLLTRVGESPVLRIDRGDGVFVATSAWTPPSSTPWVVAGGDLNNDGLIDLVYGLGGSGATVQAQFGRSALTADGAAPPAVQHPFIFKATDAAAYTPRVSPGEWMSVFGLNFQPAGTPGRLWTSADIQNGVLPTTLGGAKVTVGGQSASISYVSPVQLNVQVPDIATAGYVRIDIQTPSGTSSGSVLVNPLAPSLFVSGRSAQGDLMPAATAADATPIGDPSTIPGARPAHPDEVIVVYGTGFGPTNPPRPAGVLIDAAPLATPATVLLAGRSLTPDYAGLTGVGLNQINFRVPADLAPGSYPLQITVGAALTQKDVHLLIE